MRKSPALDEEVAVLDEEFYSPFTLVVSAGAASGAALAAFSRYLEYAPIHVSMAASRPLEVIVAPVIASTLLSERSSFGAPPLTMSKGLVGSLRLRTSFWNSFWKFGSSLIFAPSPGVSLS